MIVRFEDVSRALDRREMDAFFQPVVDLRLGRVTGFEVLARWRHPIGGPILPENFISVAEESGLIGELMEQVCGKAFQASTLLRDGLTLAVNVSPVQMRNPELPALIHVLQSTRDSLLANSSLRSRKARYMR